MPELFVITGSNGAGKSTVGPSYFPDNLQDVFDGDKLYLEKRSELWKSGLRVQRELNSQASEFVDLTFYSLVENAISQSLDFAYEGHFSKDESWNILHQFKNEGYTVHLIFFGLDSEDISSDRVLIRAKEGGHHVDPLTLRENYFGNLHQVNDRYQLFNTLKVIDTSELEHKDLVFILDGKVVEALDISQQPSWLINYMPNIARLINL
ncbi:hypothetical protein FAZ19_02395 [Sphingobacterium alkalisoli]|uniref:Zeta toxin domain-containing protein n=1 Tax=Sphingobacterium alkalisoli TaxID=1874115 RepID=A0A4U0H8H3_9SPHI|nr:zeta toxin family protein [Sphingobacterium alkalisoli]TJY68130.1 hypothetical protein FAZ19_02395 [Sphingobacterium alkalisoli]GGH08859.1 hypothetical protein GCM10011418_06520 [Sphingobacterium alkalisoli]